MHINIQSEVLASIIKGHFDNKEVLRYVEPGFFHVESYKWLIKTLKARNWETFPWDYADTLIMDYLEKDEDKLTIYRTQIWELYCRELTFAEDAENEMIEFVAFSIMKSGVKEAFDSYERSKRVDYFLDSIKGEVSKAVAVVEGKKTEVIDYAETYEDRRLERKYNRDNPDTNPVIKMGISGLDSQFGIKGAMIVNWLAPFKSYKSIFLNQVTASGVMQGYNGLHVILENSVDLTTSRYDALFNQMSYDRIVAAALVDEESQEMDKRMQWINSWSSRLKIMKGMPRYTTVPMISDMMDRLEEQEGFVPDFITIDYANIVEPTEKLREERLQQQRVFWDIKQLVESRNKPCFTATQSTQEGNKTVRLNKKGIDDQDVKRLDTSHQSKAIDISQAVDLTIAINQTPQEKEEGIIMVEPLIARNWEIYQKEVFLNCDIPRMMVNRDMDPLWEVAKKVHNI